MLDAAVWEDLRRLLSEPERVRKEYERRLQGSETGPEQEVQHLGKMTRDVKKMIFRLIDAYGDGLHDKSEFEPRISAARERLAKLEAEYRQRTGEAAQEADLRLVIGQLEEFARRVSQGLQEPDWDTRREVVRALIKQIEIDEQEVRIVYRVSPSPFERGPQQGSSQHCWGRDVGKEWGGNYGARVSLERPPRNAPPGMETPAHPRMGARGTETFRRSSIARPAARGVARHGMAAGQKACTRNKAGKSVRPFVHDGACMTGLASRRER